jgi:chromosome segregation ATPase
VTPLLEQNVIEDQHLSSPYRCVTSSSTGICCNIADYIIAKEFRFKRLSAFFSMAHALQALRREGGFPTMPKAHRPSHQESTHRGSSGGERPSPSERLKQLQVELDQHNAHIDHLSKQRDALATDITDLSTNVSEVQTTLSTYAGAFQDLQSRLQSLQYFFDLKNRMASAAIGDLKAPIDELIRDFQHDIERMQKRLSELKDERDAAQKESENAASDQAKLQQRYDTLNQYQAKLTAQLTDMEDMRSQITQYDDKNDAASMYFLLLEFRNELRDTHIISQQRLAAELREKLGELEAAKEQARAKSAAYNVLDAEYNAHSATLQAKLSGRRDQLLAAVQALLLQPTSATASTAATATGSAGATAGSAAATSGSNVTSVQK